MGPQLSCLKPGLLGGPLHKAKRQNQTVPFVPEVLDSQTAQASPCHLWLQEGRGDLDFHKVQGDPEAHVHQGFQVAQAAQGDPANHSLPWAPEAPSAEGKA